MNGTLKPTGDRKTRSRSSQLNTFGLKPGKDGSCPLATEGEGGCCNIREGRRLPTCYVYRLMNCYKGIRKSLEHNTELLKKSDEQGMEDILKHEFHRFLKAEEKAEPGSPHNYRLHWSGDIFNLKYARALRKAMDAYPGVKFWCYTRSFFSVPMLAGLSNLTLYLSIDRVNAEKGFKAYEENKKSGNVFFSYLSPEDPVILRKHGYLPCPVDSGSMDLEGACHRCGLCIKGCNIWFKER